MLAYDSLIRWKSEIPIDHHLMSVFNLFVDIDECASNPCADNVICEDRINSFSCLSGGPAAFGAPRGFDTPQNFGNWSCVVFCC